MMRMAINQESSVPIYQQIVDYFSRAILSGQFETEMRLPSIRKLSSDLGVSKITVENAYARLEAEGLVGSRVGSGTFVLPIYDTQLIENTKDSPTWPVWQQQPITSFQRTVQENAYPRAGDGLGEKDLVNFASGIGDPNLFPVNDFGRVMQRIIRREGVEGLSYGEFNGYLPLRKTICQIMASSGMVISPDNILITTGSQQAISLVAQALLKNGDNVIAEKNTYNGALGLFEALHVNPIGIAVDDKGMCVEHLEPLLQTYHPKLIYTIPTFHNPSGVCMSGSRRRMLVELSRRYNVPILEDDYIGDLRYEGAALPPLKSIDTGGNVMYVSTFSKMLMPDLRIGFLVAMGPIYDRLVSLKCLNDLATPNLSQRSLNAYLSVGSYQSHLRKLIRIYKKRRDVMVAAVTKFLGNKVTFQIPQGGLFLWLSLKQPLPSQELFKRCFEEGVSYVPGNRYMIDKTDDERYVRLNFTYHPEDDIYKGIERIGKVLDNF
mgnify:FL=1